MQKTLIALLGLLVLFTGCDNRDLLTEDLLDSQMATTKVDDLKRTMDFVFGDGRFERKEFEEEIATGLNRWASEVSTDADKWSMPEDVAKLVEMYSQLPTLDRVDQVSFLNTDGYYLQQAAWAKRIGQRILNENNFSKYEFFRLATGAEDVESFVDMIKPVHPELGDDDLETLGNSIQIFDWVVRNIQLQPETEITEDNVMDYVVVRDSNIADDKAQSHYLDVANRAVSGVPGLGYTHLPFQTLVYGRGDYISKAKLFMVLCHQLGIDTVMLACEQGDQQVPWLPAVMIGDQLYLFDTELGLPLPGETLGSVATLEQVRKNGELLAGLDLSLEESTRDKTKYRVRPDQIDAVTGLVYVSPEGISRRMAFLEDKLLGDQRLVLNDRPDAIMKKAGGYEGVSAKLWDIGFRTREFRSTINSVIKEAVFDSNLRDKIGWYYDEESYIDDFVRYRTARNLYFIGKFETERNSREISAIGMFSSLMYSDNTVEGLATNKTLLYRLGIRADNQSSAEFKNRLDSVQSQMRLIRRDAGLFLAQSCFDFGNIGTCSNWLRRVKEKGYSERWNTGLNYLMARSFETTREYDRALELYESGEHNQFHGNLIRARMLRDIAVLGQEPPKQMKEKPPEETQEKLPEQMKESAETKRETEEIIEQPPLEEVVEPAEPDANEQG